MIEMTIAEFLSRTSTIQHWVTSRDAEIARQAGNYPADLAPLRNADTMDGIITRIEALYRDTEADQGDGNIRQLGFLFALTFIENLNTVNEFIGACHPDIYLNRPVTAGRVHLQMQLATSLVLELGEIEVDRWPEYLTMLEATSNGRTIAQRKRNLIFNYELDFFTADGEYNENVRFRDLISRGH